MNRGPSTTTVLGVLAAVLVVCQIGGTATAVIDVTIKEWDVPAGAYPHDPAVAPDGSVWYTGQRGNVLGRFDPATGQIKQYPLPTASSGPHGLVADQQGSIWYTGNSAGLIGKLDPKTGHVTEYKMPNPAARDPHTPLFDQKGTLWFTVQGGNFVGKLDPATGVIMLKPSPTPRSLPYGLVITSKGVPFFDMFGTNKIGSIDPDTMAITEYVLPSGARPRRIAITPDDVIWYTDYGRGFLGRLDPKTKQVKEFKSPGGDDSRPYGITTGRDGSLWYSESGVEPNTVVQFDPKTERMQTWNIPSGGGVVRNMVAAPDGTLWLACSGVNKIARVTIKEAAATR